MRPVSPVLTAFKEATRLPVSERGPVESCALERLAASWAVEICDGLSDGVFTVGTIAPGGTNRGSEMARTKLK